MKTLEMLNEIKPEQKMARVKSDHSYCHGHVSFIDGVLCWDDNKNFPFQLSYKHLNGDEWELVRKSVDFMTAVNSGQNIKPVEAEIAFERWQYWNLTLDRINGKWFIE